MIVNWILALASSVLLILLFPGFNFSWLAPIAIAPLLVACARETKWRKRFAFGYTAGFGYWFGLCHWITWTLTHHAGIGQVAAWLIFFLFCLAKALQLGIFAAFAGLMLRGSRFGVPAVAALWVTIEWTQNFGFEWLNLGNAASDMSILLRLAPFTGVWGLSFVFALMAAVVASKVLRRQRLAAVWLLLLPGLFFLPGIPAPRRGDKSAVIVQPNIGDETLWTPELRDLTEQQLSRLSLTLTRNRPTDLIVWPEMPGPFYTNDTRFLSLVGSVAQSAQAGVVTGAVGRAASGAPLNSALLVGRDGAVISRYDKVNLLPFGEFVPWPLGALTRKISTEAGDFESGDKVVVSPLSGHKVGTFICYEAVFSGYVRKFAAAGAEVLVNISNDSWFGTSQARYQHLHVVRMRAAENQRWIVRATNDGVSAMIDPAGRVVNAEPEFREAAARMQFDYREDLTIYTRFGDWFVALCGLVAGLFTAALRFRPEFLR